MSHGVRCALRDAARLAEACAGGDMRAMPALRRARRVLDAARPEVGALDVDATSERVSWRVLPDGAIEATMAVTLPDGSERTYRARHRDEEVGGAVALMRAWPKIKRGLKRVAADYKAGRITRAEGERRIAALQAANDVAKNKKEGISLSGVGKALKKVASVAKKGLAVAALVTPPPINAAAAGAAAALAVADKLTDAAKPAVDAVKDAKKLADKLAPGASAAVLRAANRKRKAMDRAARTAVRDAQRAQKRALKKLKAKQRKAAKRAKPKPKRRPKPKKKRTNDVLAAARKGRLRSPTGGSVSAAELVRAHGRGRVYWVAA